MAEGLSAFSVSSIPCTLTTVETHPNRLPTLQKRCIQKGITLKDKQMLFRRYRQITSMRESPSISQRTIQRTAIKDRFVSTNPTRFLCCCSRWLFANEGEYHLKTQNERKKR